MKHSLTYSNDRRKDFLFWAWNNPLIVGLAMVFLCVVYFFAGIIITTDVYEQGTINFAKSICGDGKIDSIRQWSSYFGGEHGAVPVSYRVVCTEKIMGFMRFIIFI